jgi:hypothetical protein
MRAHVRALNEHRRSRTKPLTKEEKNAKIAAALEADPARSDRAIAAETETSPTKVGKVRAEKAAEGVLVDTPPAKRKSRTGKAGEGQHKIAAVKITPGQKLSTRPTKKQLAASPTTTATGSNGDEIVAEVLAPIDGARSIRL